MYTVDSPMTTVDEPDTPGFVYDCPRCGFVVVVPRPGFAPGHAVCTGCWNKDHVHVKLCFVEYYYPPTKVWEGDYA